MQVKLLRPNRKQSNSFLNESVNEKYFGDIDDTSLRIVKLRLICGGIMESIQAQVFVRAATLPGSFGLQRLFAPHRILIEEPILNSGYCAVRPVYYAIPYSIACSEL